MTDDTPRPAAPEHDTVDVPTTCETCGTTLETGMVGVSDADIGSTPQLPATTVVEVFCPNAECPAHKPEAHPATGAAADADVRAGDADAHDAPGSMGGANGGA